MTRDDLSLAPPGLWRQGPRAPTARVCHHLLLDEPEDGIQDWSLDGALLCLSCAEQTILEHHLVRVDQHIFEHIYEEGGEWRPRERPPERLLYSGLKLMQTAGTSQPLPAMIAACVCAQHPSPLIFSVDEQLTLWSSDLDQGHLLAVMTLELEPVEGLVIVASDDGRYVAIGQRRGSLGVVIDVQAAQVISRLDRQRYYPEHGDFGLAFIRDPSGRSLLIHQSDWNRHDLLCPASGQILTERALSQEEAKDYFCCNLVTSPNSQWVADSGWFWGPVGMVCSWNTWAWLNDPAEPERGPSARNHPKTYCAYGWNRPMCFIDEHTLAVWGFGADEEWMLDAIECFDVRTGARVCSWFGPRQGHMSSDGQRLYVFGPDQPLEVWSIAQGARLACFEEARLLLHHRARDQFISQDAQGRWCLWQVRA